MTRFIVDAGAALQLASDAIEVSSEHELLAPTSSVPRRWRTRSSRWTASWLAASIDALR